MGKYTRKAKITGDVAVMEIVSQSSLGVRTRARTLALQPPPPPPPEQQNSEKWSYLELRNRRLEKSPSPNRPRIHPKPKIITRDRTGKNSDAAHDSNSKPRVSSNSRNSGSVSCLEKNEGCIGVKTVDARNEEDETKGKITPSMEEIEEFFALAEQQHLRHFSAVYNFDFENDSPLPGCYEWVRVNLSPFSQKLMEK